MTTAEAAVSHGLTLVAVAVLWGLLMWRVHDRSVPTGIALGALALLGASIAWMAG